MLSRPRLRTVAGAAFTSAVFVILLFHPFLARANMAMRVAASRPGDTAGEPQGNLKSVRIERETLLIDLRPLALSRPSIIEATYRVRNDGAALNVELVFVAAALATGEGAWVWKDSRWQTDAKEKPLADMGVWLDGQAVPGARAEMNAQEEPLPKSWQPPNTTPALEDGGDALPYKATSGGTIVFRVTITPGQHDFRVRYAARPTAFSGLRSDAIYWQLGYVLAPAREWGSFGGLDAKVLLPKGWRASSLPAMRREGDALVATWNEVPADALALTVQTTDSTVQDVGAYWVILIIFGLLLALPSGIVGWLTGRRLGQRKRTSAWALLISLPVGVACVLVSVFISGIIASPSAPAQAAFNRVGGYDFIITLPLLALTFVVSFMVTQLSAFIARRRAR